MQKKFTIKKNVVKVAQSNKSTKETKSKSITKKTLSDGPRVNIISSVEIDTSNLERLTSPIDAERANAFSDKKSLAKRRRAVKDLTLKSAPPVPTAPKDPRVRKRMWILSQIKSHASSIDIPTSLLTLTLSVCGLLAIYSATLTFNSLGNVLVQSFGIVLGVIFAIILSVTDYRSFASKYRYIIAVNAFILLFTYVFGSSVTEGTNSNWIDLGVIKIQPSEFAKLLFIYSFAVHLAQVRDRMHKFSTVLSLATHAFLIFGLVLLQKDLGALTIFLVIFVCMCFAAGISIWYYIAGGAVLLCVSPFLWSKLNVYQRDRILLCFDSSIDPGGTGIRYQQMRSQTAIGNGKIIGTGFTKGTVTQALTDKLPAKHTDMIFSTVCEEWGMIGALAVLLLITALIIRILKIALSCGNTTGRYICVGVASMLMIQVIENVGMCLGIMPVIGITFPFLSYGGSSVLSCFLAIGMVLSVSTHKENKFFS